MIAARLRSLWRNLTRRRQVEHELDAELRAYVELLAQEGVGAGLSEAEARRRALIELGGLEQVKEEVRAVRIGAWWEQVRQDARYAVRGLIRSPGFTIVAVSTLALGIGANVAIFSVMDSVLLRSLPFRDADRLLVLGETREGREGADLLSGHEYVAWRESNRTFEDLAIWSGAGFNLTAGGSGEAESIAALEVSANFFSVFGVTPLLGRAFLAGEDAGGASHVVILSHRLWTRRFSPSGAVVGSKVVLNDEPYTVVGVMPPLDGIDPEMWVPMDVAAEAERVGKHSNFVIGRLKPGITREQGVTDLTSIARRLATDFPALNTGHGVHAVGIYESIVGDVRRPVFVAFGAVAFVLLIGCVNVAHLQLARGASRQAEMAVRGAIGASRARIVRQLLTESLLLSAIGGTIGLLLALAIVRTLPVIVAGDIPRLGTVSIDARVVAATIVFMLLAGVLAGIVPALRGSRPHLQSALADGGRVSDGVSQRLSGFFVISEVALALVLCIGAGLMLRSFARLTDVNPGFVSDDVVTGSIALPASRYDSPPARLEASRQLIQRLAQQPGFTSVSAVTSLPLGNCCDGYPITVEGKPAPLAGHELSAVMNVISDDYFRTMQVPLQSGRVFTEGDARRAVPIVRYYEQQPLPAHSDEPQPIPVAVISASMARQLWPGKDPIGRRFRALFSPWLTVIGVVSDVRHAGLDRPFLPDFYLSLSQEPRGDFTVVARTTGDAASQFATVRDVVRAFDASLPVSDLRTLDDVLGRSIGTSRFSAIVLGAFGAVALLLSLIGTYGVISYGVTQRLGEIGVRTALGARARDVSRLILGRAMRLSLFGVLIGLAGSLALTKTLGTLLYDVSPTDPLTFVGVAALLVGVSAAASYFPARRALRVDPLTAMKHS